jgi:hypothetical protein
MAVYKGEKIDVLDYIKEIHTKIAESTDYKQILVDAKAKLKKDLAKGYQWGKIEQVPIKKLKLDYQVQRDFVLKHAFKTIIANFDPRIVTSPVCVKSSKEDEYHVVDGQHGPTISRIMVAVLNAEDYIPCWVIHEDDPAFKGKLFIVLNKTGKLGASYYDTLKVEVKHYDNALEVLKKDPNDINARDTISDPTYINASETVKVFADVNIDLEPTSTRGTTTSGGNDFYFSHIQYARENTALIKRDAMKKILEAYKKVWCTPDSDPKVDNGLFSGMVYLYSDADRKDCKLPDDWIEQVYQVLKDNLGASAEHIHNACIKAQCKEVTRTWSTKTQCPTAIRDIFVRCADPKLLQKINLPYDKNLNLKIVGEDADLVEGFNFKKIA